MTETFERKLSALKTLVDMMPRVPEKRRDVSKRANVHWLIRNMGIKSVEGVNENVDHPLYRTTIDQLIWVGKNWEED